MMNMKTLSKLIMYNEKFFLGVLIYKNEQVCKRLTKED